ncbi:pyridoxamine 5'-phosphate oxidase family protein [Prolixibacteraceae bacterium Z1-6]|uniref:Pyridoxamine 5'-phosphate oxidase family protein n=1 Tax=Draconibacterium aestuarii TaxID=2998507 RepID=A0A9X3F5X3_9BACT|nr:pyridoxamine 5'-phosphate oxidase family protein [Prolixibacteraceae bacterium Z1-6]
MKIDEFIHFAKDNPVCFLATTDGDQPHVRAILLFFADKTGFYFGTLSPKEMSKQLHKNPKVELCFYNNPHDFSQAKQMRLTGKAEFVKDPEMIHKLHEERLFLDDIAGQNLEPYSEVFKVTAGDIHFWSISDVMNETHLEHLVF